MNGMRARNTNKKNKIAIVVHLIAVPCRVVLWMCMCMCMHVCVCIYVNIIVSVLRSFIYYYHLRTEFFHVQSGAVGKSANIVVNIVLQNALLVGVFPAHFLLGQDTLLRVSVFFLFFFFFLLFFIFEFHFVSV